MTTGRQRPASTAARRAKTAQAQPDQPADPGTRERLLATGLEMARREGLKAMSVRGVAAEAGVNLGSFVYHFGTRDAFVYELVERWYAPLMASLQLSASGSDPLREVTRQLAHWAATHGRFLALLVRDATAGEPGVRQFLATVDQRHIALLLHLIREGQQAGRLRKADPALQLMFLMGSVAMPILMVQSLQGVGGNPFLHRLTELASDEAAIDTRIAWALQGLAAPPGG